MTDSEAIEAIKQRMRDNKSPAAPSLAKTEEELIKMMMDFVERAWEQRQAIPLYKVNRRFNKMILKLCGCSPTEFIEKLKTKELLHTFMHGSSSTYVVPFEGYAEFLAEAEAEGTDITALHAQIAQQLDFRNI